MSLHKLSAGDGYTYLTRQVAAADEAVLRAGAQRREDYAGLVHDLTAMANS